MEKKTKPFVSKAQAARAYTEYKKGNISYEDLMKGVHQTGDMSKLPERVKEKVDKKTAIAVRGLI